MSDVATGPAVLAAFAIGLTVRDAFTRRHRHEHDWGAWQTSQRERACRRCGDIETERVEP